MTHGDKRKLSASGKRRAWKLTFFPFLYIVSLESSSSWQAKPEAHDDFCIQKLILKTYTSPVIKMPTCMNCHFFPLKYVVAVLWKVFKLWGWSMSGHSVTQQNCFFLSACIDISLISVPRQPGQWETCVQINHPILLFQSQSVGCWSSECQVTAIVWMLGEYEEFVQVVLVCCPYWLLFLISSIQKWTIIEHGGSFHFWN